MRYRRVTSDWLRHQDNRRVKEDREKYISFLSFTCSTVVHLFFLFTVVFNTLIPIVPLMYFYFLGILSLGYILKRRAVCYPGWKSYFIFPTICNLIFTLNYLVSWPAGKETYRFRPSIETVPVSGNRYVLKVREQLTTKINLVGGKYHEYFGIRVFSSMEKFRNARKVTYSFNKGLFGLRTLHDYTFEP